MIHDKLTDYQIVDAFPNECREYCPPIIQNLELKLIRKRSALREIEISKHPDWIKIILNMMIECIYPKALQITLDKNKRFLELLKDKNRPNFNDDQMLLSKAKSQPIEGLYNFESVRKFGNRVKAICPFHKENTPSFMIYVDQNKFHCFGCGLKGDSIDFFMKLNNVGFKQAMEALQ